MTKEWIVDFKLMQLSASHYWHSVQVEAPDIGMAVKRAWALVKKKPQVKGKRLKEASVTIRLVEAGGDE
jgi:hypothetical protein